MYVNLLTRRPDHFNFRNSTKLQNFVAANEIIFRLYGKLNNDDLKASEKYYSLRNWFTIIFCLKWCMWTVHIRVRIALAEV